ncbi:osmolarity response regulator transcription factor OmpR [Leeia aquatica]|uniref:Two-component system response regulator OmpR n=1 Tax=Leeia aquatica TaxID=2725557 RepID=A0A847SC11_9NEIS|nr:two-component system response regulator OmpR [Leeia aquatica]NLR76417.1 two-component system response regulator OmpR [Leeia aquatica]
MTSPSRRLLLIDDDARIRELLTRYLTEQGFDVDVYADASQLEKRLQQRRPHLLILDLMLPGEDGLSVCRKIRARNDNLPIIMLTARGDDVDRIIGLEMGADDYLPKPFNPRELLARIQAVLRRQAEVPALAAALDPEEVYVFADYRLDAGQRKLFRNDVEIPLSQAEFSLLKVLAMHPRHPLSRERLLELSRGREFEAFDRSVDVQISRLRKLIEADPSQPGFIQTVWGFGYVFVPDGATTTP